MKTQFYITLFIFSALFTSCSNDDEYGMYTIATPEFMTIDDFRSSVRINTPEQIVESGKIYAFNNLVLVNDVDKGIHIVDNTNPLNPVKKAFIKILLNKDMEIRGNYLYADSFMDLLVFDISDLNTITQVSRLKDVFPNYLELPSIDNLIVEYGDTTYNENNIIVNWNLKEEVRKIEEVHANWQTFDNFIASNAIATTSGGQGGSLARFKIVDDYLYAVDNYSLNVFDITNLDTPIELDDIYAGFGIETIFNRDNYLFLGSTNGMFIYDITSAATPLYVSEFTHATACDPVVVDDNYAYVTLRGGNSCGAFESSLEVIDISDIQNPFLLKSYPMDNPYGLGIKENLLFICDGDSGLKVYNKEDLEDLNLLNTFKDATAFDVIPLENSLLMIGSNTLYQYNYLNNGLNLISEFSLN